MQLYRLGELNLVPLTDISLIRVPINESLLYIHTLVPEIVPVNQIDTNLLVPPYKSFIASILLPERNTACTTVEVAAMPEANTNANSAFSSLARHDCRQLRVGLPPRV